MVLMEFLFNNKYGVSLLTGYSTLVYATLLSGLAVPSIRGLALDIISTLLFFVGPIVGIIAMLLAVFTRSNK